MKKIQIANLQLPGNQKEPNRVNSLYQKAKKKVRRDGLIDTG